ncbi:integrase core domain-containing protein, partial [Puniceibacterium antarcticum]|uniref:integrase core domain-containing protein n=1 Tax=Puniceibacterium antarcticum TaxID=1206336 RepID=UPI001FE6EDFE
PFSPTGQAGCRHRPWWLSLIIYLRAYARVSEARAGIARYFDIYNSRRPHSSLDGKAPDQA